MNLIAILLLLVQTIHGYNIVVYTTLVAKSHLVFISSMMDILIENGHTVDFVVGEFHSEVKWKGATRARNTTSFSFPEKSPWLQTTHLSDPFNTQETINQKHFFDSAVAICKIGLQSGNAVNFMKHGKYDAALVSDYDYCGFILARAAGIKTVLSFTSTNLLYFQLINLGLPSPISCESTNFDVYGDDFSLLGKLKRLFRNGKQYFIDFRRPVQQFNQIARKQFGSNFPDVQQLARDVDVVFVNTNEIIEMPRTITHKIRYIGGVGLTKPKPISKEYDEILNMRDGNVIISFGTQVPAEKFDIRTKTAIARAALAFPDYTFIWKYKAQAGDADIFENATNVKFVNWLPQTDLLYSKRVSGFITHAGMNSFQEFAHAGVPVVLIPLFADQEFNARNAARLGLGVQLDKLTFTSTELIAGLNKILKNPSYAQNSRHIAKMLDTSPVKVRDEFLKWAEFAIENGKLHKLFNLPAADVSAISYYCIDLLLIMTIASGFICFALYSTYINFKNTVHGALKKVKTN